MIAVAVLALSAGCLAAALVFYALALRACRRAMDALAEARRIHEGVDGLLERSLDTVARAEEFTL